MTDHEEEGCKHPASKRPRIGNPQLLLATPELRKRTGKKYCDESELLSLCWHTTWYVGCARLQ